MTALNGWIVEPRHGFFAKDARGWFAGPGNQGNSLPWLYPTTLRGAFCSAIGRELEQQQGIVYRAKEWLALKAQVKIRHALALRIPVGQSFSPTHRVWPAPADAVYLQGNTHPVRLAASPAKVQIWDSGSDPRTTSLQLLAIVEGTQESIAKPQPGPAWWSEAEWEDWLCGTEHAGPKSNLAKSRQPHSRADVHVKMCSESETAEAGFLWKNEFRETLTLGDANQVSSPSHGDVNRWAFGLTTEITESAASTVMPKLALLAGDRQLASVERTSNLTAFPGRLKSCLGNRPPAKRLRIYAVTPTVFRDGWCPDGFGLKNGDLVGILEGIGAPVRLIAAAVQRPTPISGWDLAASDDGGSPDGARQNASGAPRTTRLACPAGSMWMFERMDGVGFTESDVQNLWLGTWGSGTDDGLGTMAAGLDPDV